MWLKRDYAVYSDMGLPLQSNRSGAGRLRHDERATGEW
jgi:hypothetical protein